MYPKQRAKTAKLCTFGGSSLPSTFTFCLQLRLEPSKYSAPKYLQLPRN
uniref:Uncharacterized protein n=1 Tax=Anguilla anguilla TaxID=7936 RepID=A0A0E9W9Z0_ANGAN